MNYEEKYKEALERAKYLKENTDSVGALDISNCFEQIFPELRESDDERIRKEIIQSIQDNMCVIHKDKCIAWLEKQGEEKSSWSEEDEKIIKRIDSLLYSQCTIHGSEYEGIHNWLKSIKPQNRWKPSEQNIKDLEWCADLVKDKMGVGFHRLQVFIDEIKKL